VNKDNNGNSSGPSSILDCLVRNIGSQEISGASSSSGDKDMSKKISDLFTPMAKSKSSGNHFKPTILFNKTPTK
jgi:hypothetical protein